MDQQLLSLICLVVGIIIGHLITRPQQKYYNDMRDFASSYSNLATQLFNAQQHNIPITTDDGKIPYDINNRPKMNEIEHDLLAGILDPVGREVN